jgi:hypothetical protein
MTTDTKLEETIGKGLLTGSAAVIVLPLAYAFLLPFSIVNAWALTVLYGWFILPVWPALPVLGVAQMLGVSLFKSTLFYRQIPKDKDVKFWSWANFFHLCQGLIALIVSYPIHWWLSH